MKKQYLDLSGAGKFLSKLKETFSIKSHKHTMSDITDMSDVRKEIISETEPEGLNIGDHWLKEY